MTISTPLTQLLPYHRELPATADEAELVNLYLDRSAAPRHCAQEQVQDPDRLWVRANMVETVDGAVTGADGRSGPISSPADKRVFSVLRALADAVVVGAGTVRAERYTRLHQKPRHAAQRSERRQKPAPLLVVISRSGVLDLDRINEAGTGGVIVHAVRSHCGEEQLSELNRKLTGTSDAVILHDDEVTPTAVLSDLRERGCREIVHEGGPHLLGTWTRAGALDELCLTTSPMLIGADTGQADGPRGLLEGNPAEQDVQPPMELTLLSLISGGSTLMQRWGLPQQARS